MHSLHNNCAASVFLPPHLILLKLLNSIEKKWNHGNWQNGVKRPASNSPLVRSVFTYLNLKCSFAKVHSGWVLHSFSPIGSLINQVKLCLVALIHSCFPASFYSPISSSTRSTRKRPPGQHHWCQLTVTTFPSTTTETSRLRLLMISGVMLLIMGYWPWIKSVWAMMHHSVSCC